MALSLENQDADCQKVMQDATYLELNSPKSTTSRPSSHRIFGKENPPVPQKSAGVDSKSLRCGSSGSQVRKTNVQARQRDSARPILNPGQTVCPAR